MKPCAYPVRSGGRPPRSPSGHACRPLAFALLFGLLVWTAHLSCRTSSEPDDPQKAIDLRLDAVPLLLKADSSSTATIWATVLISDRPAPDSTVVNFASTLGTVTSEAYTRAGLARAVFAAGDEPGTAAVVAQVLAVRDTVVLTVY